jgi:hypothetical protein
VGLGREVDWGSCVRRWELRVGVIWWRESESVLASSPRLLLARMAMEMSFVSCSSFVLWWPDLFVSAVDCGGYEDRNVSCTLISLSGEIEVQTDRCSRRLLMRFLMRRNCMDCHVLLSLVLLARSTAYIRNASTCAHSWYSGTSFTQMFVVLCRLSAVAWLILLQQLASNTALTLSSHRLEPCPARSATWYGRSYASASLLVACYRLFVVSDFQRTHLISSALASYRY